MQREWIAEMSMSEAEGRFRAFIAAIEGAAGPDRVWDAVFDFVLAAGFPRLCYLHHDARTLQPWRLMHSRGFNPDWISDWVNQDLPEMTPAPWAAMSRGDPLRWSEMGTLPRLAPAEAAFHARYLRSGTEDGLAIPVFGPRRRAGYFGLGCAVRGEEADALMTPERARMLQVVCHGAHLRVCRLLETGGPGAPRLSAREREVLHWMAKGKSNPAIAEILGCSAHTVDTHVRRLFAKLGVTDRISCVVRAVAAGLVAG